MVSFRSEPVQKARSPAPVRMATRIASSKRIRSQISRSCSRPTGSMAFIARGRLMVTSATWSVTSISMLTSSLLSAARRRAVSMEILPNERFRGVDHHASHTVHIVRNPLNETARSRSMDESTREDGDGTQTIRRCVAILNLLAANNRLGMRLVDVYRALDLSRPTVHRMLQGLDAESLVRQDQQ